jgi:Rieske Fe-S protein
MEDHNRISLTRRKMIRALGWLTLIPLTGLWGLMVKRNQERKESSKVKVLLSDISSGKTYFQDFYIDRDSDRVVAYSMRCTHLGCRLKLSVDDQLVCPCHGSAFDPDSRAASKGPAAKPLEMLESKIEGNHLIIILS